MKSSWPIRNGMCVKSRIFRFGPFFKMGKTLGIIKKIPKKSFFSYILFVTVHRFDYETLKLERG